MSFLKDIKTKLVPRKAHHQEDPVAEKHDDDTSSSSSSSDEGKVFAGGKVPKWKVSTHYNVGNRVRFSGKVYECTFAHTSTNLMTPVTGMTNWKIVEY